jgi:peroxiredoxin
MSPTSLARVAFLPLALVAGIAFGIGAGIPAPGFSVADANGKTVKLSDYKGRFVVLEWTNPECPFVRAQYGANAMQSLQKEAGAKDVVWLSVNSTNKSHREHKTGAQMTQWMKDKDGAPRAVLIDDTSDAARAYEAKTTPHMFVVDPAGRIVYAGAIDDKRAARESDRASANNYVRAALNEALAGKPVTVANTTPYGCSVKY